MPSYTAQLVLGAIVLAVYLIVMFFVANNYIRLANLRWLEAHQDALRGRVEVQAGDPAPPATADAAAAAIDLLVPEIVEAGDRHRGWRGLWSTRNWIGSQEIGAWVRLHEAQRIEVWRLPDDAVQARFARAMGQVDELSAVRQNAWQRRWVDLQATSRVNGSPDPLAARRWRAELSQLLAELFNARDSTYNQLVSLYGKAGWLVLAAYLPVVALLVAGYGFVLLAGFLGGLISRMQRVVYGKGRPTAYGTSWVPLFIAPLLGSLAAWAGLHLLSMLQAIGVVNLNTVIGSGETFRGLTPVSVLGVGVLLGFSERFFNQLGVQAESVMRGDDVTGSSAAAGSPTSPFQHPNAPGGQSPNGGSPVPAGPSGDRDDSPDPKPE